MIFQLALLVLLDIFRILSPWPSRTCGKDISHTKNKRDSCEVPRADCQCQKPRTSTKEMDGFSWRNLQDQVVDMYQKKNYIDLKKVAGICWILKIFFLKMGSLIPTIYIYIQNQIQCELLKKTDMWTKTTHEQHVWVPFNVSLWRHISGPSLWELY